MPSDMERLLAKFNGNPAVDADGLARFASESQFVLPQEYVRFLRRAIRRHGTRRSASNGRDLRQLPRRPVRVLTGDMFASKTGFYLDVTVLDPLKAARP